ncbi:hypothetical protein CBM2608_A50016 [Cupriavidus taiwanensis]|nr:hypothetical protein CBM2608_A50016 [Cupriavidus taiwanensis]
MPSSFLVDTISLSLSEGLNALTSFGWAIVRAAMFVSTLFIISTFPGWF